MHIKIFPEINENGLRFIASAYQQQAEGNNIYWGYNQDYPESAQGNYLDQGTKLHIYYTRDTNGNQANPRVVIVEGGGKVTEVRGIEWEENIDDYMKAADVIRCSWLGSKRDCLGSQRGF